MLRAISRIEIGYFSNITYQLVWILEIQYASYKDEIFKCWPTKQISAFKGLIMSFINP